MLHMLNDGRKSQSNPQTTNPYIVNTYLHCGKGSAIDPLQDVKEIINAYDEDGSASLDFAEFLMLTAKLDPRYVYILGGAAGSYT